MNDNYKETKKQKNKKNKKNKKKQENKKTRKQENKKTRKQKYIKIDYLHIFFNESNVDNQR